MARTLPAQMAIDKGRVHDLTYFVEIDSTPAQRWGTVDKTIGGNAYDGGRLIPGGITAASDSIDLIEGSGTFQRNSVTVRLRNEDGFYDTLPTLHNIACRVRCTTETGASIAEALTLKVWEGVVSDIAYTKKVLTISLTIEDESNHLDLPSATVEDSDYPDAHADFIGRHVPFAYGREVLCEAYLVDVKNGIYLLQISDDNYAVADPRGWVAQANTFSDIKASDTTELIKDNTPALLPAGAQNRSYVRFSLDQGHPHYLEVFDLYPDSPYAVAGELDETYDVGSNDDQYKNTATNYANASRDDATYATLIVPDAGSANGTSDGSKSPPAGYAVDVEPLCLRFRRGNLLEDGDEILGVIINFVDGNVPPDGSSITGTSGDDELGFHILLLNAGGADIRQAIAGAPGPTGRYAPDADSVGSMQLQGTDDATFAADPSQFALVARWELDSGGAAVDGGDHAEVAKMYATCTITRHDIRDRLLFVAQDGKDFDSWITGRTSDFSDGDVIEDPVHVIEGILRNEMGIATAGIDEDSFDACENDRGTFAVAATSWKYSFQLTEEIHSRQLLQDLCYFGGLALTADVDGKYRCISLEAVSSPSRTVTSSDIDSETEPNVSLTPLSSVYNTVHLDYQPNKVTGQYAGHDVSNDATSETTYSLTRELHVQCDYIQDSTTAANWGDFMLSWLKDRRRIVDLVCFISVIDVEVGDQVGLNLDIVSDGTYIVLKTSLDPRTDRIKLTLLEMPS
jgi:hypothetical protein